MRGFIDQFEDEWVVVEIEGKTTNIARSRFPKEAQVGDLVHITDARITVLQEETEKRRREIEQLMDEVWED